MHSVALFYASVILSGAFGYLFCYFRNQKKNKKLAETKAEEMKKFLIFYALGFHRESLANLIGQPEFQDQKLTHQQATELLQEKLWQATEKYSAAIKCGHLEPGDILSVAWFAFMCLEYSKNQK